MGAAEGNPKWGAAVFHSEADPLEMEADGGGARAGGFAVFFCEDLGDSVGFPMPCPNLEYGADHGSDHVVEEAGAFDGEDDEGAVLGVRVAVDVAGEDGAGGVFAVVGLAFEGFEGL